jgi:O-antigen/teichoic acid export membrane protein
MISDAVAKPPLNNSGNTERSQIRGSSLLLGGRILALLINCLAQILVVRYLSTTEYGAWAYGLSVVIACEAFSALSLEQSLARFVPIYFEHRQFSRLIGAVVLSLGVIGAASFLFLLPFYAFPGALSRVIREPQSQQLLLILILLVPLESTDALFEGLLASFNSARAIFVRRYMLAPLLKVAAILAVRAAGLNVRWLAMAYLAAAAVGLLFYTGTLKQNLGKRGLLHRDVLRHIDIPARELLAFTFPVMTTTIVSVLNHSIAAMMLGFFHNAVQVAFYRVIYPIATLNQVVFQAFLVLYTPSAARLFARNDTRGIHRLYWSNAVWMGTLSFPIFIVTCGFARPLITFLYGARYQPSSMVLLLIATGYFVSVSMGFNVQTLQVFGKIRYIVIVNMSAIVANIVANLIVIPRYGAVGAAAVTLGTIVLHNLLNQGALWLLGIRLPGRRYWGFFIVLPLAGASVFVIHFLAEQHLFLAILLSAVAAAAVLLAGVSELDLHETFPEAVRLPLIGTLCARKFSLRYFLLKALDAIVTSGTTRDRRWTQDARALVQMRGAHYDRIASASRLMARIAPAATERASRRLLRPETLPFAFSRIEVAGYGFSATVFRIATSSGEYALKIYRDSLGYRIDDALATAAAFRSQHERIAAAYNRDRELVLPVKFCVLQSPLLGSVAAAGVQPYLSGKRLDLFRDFDDQQLLALARENESFRRDLAAFAHASLELAGSADFCLDILGQENVVVALSPVPRLVVMDTGGFQLSHLERVFPERLVRLHSYLNRLDTLARQLEIDRPGAHALAVETAAETVLAADAPIEPAA